MLGVLSSCVVFYSVSVIKFPNLEKIGDLNIGLYY